MFRSNVRPIALAALALIVAGSHAQSSRYSAPIAGAETLKSGHAAAFTASADASAAQEGAGWTTQRLGSGTSR